MAIGEVHVFVNKEAARRVGLDLTTLTTYDRLFGDKKLKQGQDFQVFAVPRNPRDREKATHGDYKRFEQDQAYTKRVMYVGN
ncbi:hypothetical protein HYY70_05970 [Candidatus Woesearchaeota archaeon]|nr:hypothetical protein [Candidatus Woesearchaeota archaeon]